MFITTRAQGAHGESQVIAYLERQGFTILERNYAQRYGEIDLIAQCKDLIVFVEVKMRSTPLLDPGELVGLTKQKRIMQTAAHYMSLHHRPANYRFDVACVIGDVAHAEILYIPDAFQDERYDT